MQSNIKKDLLDLFHTTYNKSEQLFGRDAMKFLSLFGLSYLSYKVIKGMGQFYTKFLAGGKDLIDRYGANTYALITGGAEGIGRGFARELGKLGFNLILLDKNEELLNQTCVELTHHFPQLSVKKIVVDFSRSYEEGFFDKLMAEIGTLEISILVNNVGLVQTGKFAEENEKMMRDLIHVNIFPATFLTKRIIPRMLRREKRSGIITVSSHQAFITFPEYSLYSCTKAYLDHLSCCLLEEYSDKIDFLSVTPGAVITGMTNFMEKCYHSCTPEECASSSLKALGRTHTTYGHWKHELWMGLATNSVLYKKLFKKDLEYRTAKAKELRKEEETMPDSRIKAEIK